MKKLFIQTYGCQMNAYDSIRIGDLLKPFGYETTEVIEESDMVVLNTCHIREKATEKVYSRLGRIRDMKRKLGKDLIIVVAGCVGQAEGEEIFKRAPWVNIVVGPQSYHNLPELLAKLARNNKHVWDLNFEEDKKFDVLSETLKPQGVSAFLSIQEGCDKFCKFCCVPYTRGAEFSRPVAQIYREALLIASQGSKEITLLGQNVNAYHGLDHEGNQASLADLIKYVSKIDEIKRIRYTTSHPYDMTDDLIEAHGSIQKLMPFLHLPVQSGSDRILKAMNRKHNVETYFDIIDRLRESRKGIAFSSDFIVGYPGETEQDFQDTMELVRRVNFAQAYSFKYSPRPGTPASSMTQVPEDIKTDRLQRLQDLINKQQHEFNDSCVGKTFDVLMEKAGKYENQFSGKSEYMQTVNIENAAQYIGEIIKVKITKASANSLQGELIKTPQVAA
ncbi:MAG: tRNA (N6-isopentenyl adenosine(37)-C2)-methylthiotransferase MiaB [Alphaproteobacteria bacterium]|nr:tRNA (N6-isopentenyl adenosine(37)-C2)-methylthiotransferase MiaB [Alphaproteobacteria bacterium]